MKRELLTILGTLALAACGSKSKPPTTTPDVVATDPDGDHDDAVDEAAAGDGHTDHHHDDHPEHAVPPTDPPPPPPGPDAGQIKADLLAAETTAYQAAKPVFMSYCASCHQQGGKKASAKKLGHFDITSYPLAGHHAAVVAETVREVLGVGGGKPTMPYNKPGAVKGAELALIVEWAKTFDAAKAGGAHDGVPGYVSGPDPE